MAHKLLTVFIVFFGVSLTSAAIQTVNGRIKITIGGTAGCSTKVNFMTNSFIPVYEEFKEFLDVEFVLWGRTRFENGTMVCQFGPNDCWANRLQRCAINMLKDNQDALVHYMACEYRRPLPAFTQGTYLCAQAVGLNLIDVDYCMSTTGDALEAPAQQAARIPMEIINYVPYIIFNDVVDMSNHLASFVRLRSLICFALAEDPTTGITNCQI